MRKILKVIGNVALVLALLGAGVVGMGGMITTRPETEAKTPASLPPYVATCRAVRETVTLGVVARGTVSAPTESLLSSEVSGRVVEVAPGTAVGGFFDAGDVLLRIDPRDMELARYRAAAALAAATARLAVVRAEADMAAREWESLEEGEASPLALRTPQLAQAQAECEAARAALEHAETDLARTVVRAPFAGCVREKIADVGQTVAPGSPLVRLFAVDAAEVRLPLSDEQAARLDLAGLRAGGPVPAAGPAVVVRGRSGGTSRTWAGRLVRVEGHVDPQSRMTTVVARVEDPYGLRAGGSRAPLSVGLFVEAEITGRTLADVTRVPRTALRSGERIPVVDGGDRLCLKPVRVVQTAGDDAVVEGLDDGDRICLTPLQAATEGMRVRTESDRTSGRISARETEVER